MHTLGILQAIFSAPYVLKDSCLSKSQADTSWNWKQKKGLKQLSHIVFLKSSIWIHFKSSSLFFFFESVRFLVNYNDGDIDPLKILIEQGDLEAKMLESVGMTAAQSAEYMF